LIKVILHLFFLIRHILLELEYEDFGMVVSLEFCCKKIKDTTTWVLFKK